VNTYLKRILAGALLSGSVAVAGIGLAAGTAQANTRAPTNGARGNTYPRPTSSGT
jgi:hypothetical protein